MDRDFTPHTADSTPVAALDAAAADLQDFVEIFREQRLTPLFQPIVDSAHAAIIGYEGLIRGPKDSRFMLPQRLFMAASRLGLDLDFELLCRRLVIQRFAELNTTRQLFLNVSPQYLLTRDQRCNRTLEFLHEAGLDPARIVIEITEHQQTHDYALLNQALSHYRELGFKVALDDLGSGYSSLRLWTEVLPDFIKIDKHFIHDIHKSPLKQGFIQGLQTIASGSSCSLIAEGVESRAEFDWLYNAGINYMQGYYFAVPARQPAELLGKGHLASPPERRPDMAGQRCTLREITSPAPPIAASTKVREVLDILHHNPALQLLPVVEQTQAAGLVERLVLLNDLGESLYDSDLHGNLQIVDFLRHTPVTVDITCSLEAASRIVTSAGSAPQAFLVTENGRYYGVCTVLDLLCGLTVHK